MLGHEKALEEIGKLSEPGLFIVISTLLESGKLNPQTFSTWCITHLANKETERQGRFYKMALMLGTVCEDPCESNINDALKYMYEEKFHEGSKFGDKLKTKFNP